MSLDAENDKGESMYIYYVDDDYLKTLGVSMLRGRQFKSRTASDSVNIILNETATKMLGLTDQTGDKVYIDSQKFNIIGITKDFQGTSLENRTEPIAILLRTPELSPSQIVVRMDGNANRETLEYIEKTWYEYAKDEPFDYAFFEQINQKKYSGFINLGKTIGLFAAISILIASLGLFGLSLFIARKKSKEIGIRKIFGATVTVIIKLINKEFLILVIIANIIACLPTWFLMNRWLQNFAFHTSVQVWMFIMALLVSGLIVLITTIVNSIKAALSNPIEYLRYE